MKVDFDIDADHIDIPLEKYRFMGFLLAAVVIGAAGLCLIVFPYRDVSTYISKYDYHFSRADIIIIGRICILFSIAASAFFFNKLLSFKPGLTIDQEGVTYNSSLISRNSVKWRDISEISTTCVGIADYILIHVNSPDEYLQSLQSAYKRRSALANLNKYSAPIVINTDLLKCNFNELYPFLTNTLKIYKAASKN